MKFLDCYKEWMKTGRLPKAGLCESLPEELEESESWKMCKRTGYDETVWQAYWAYEFGKDDPHYKAKDHSHAFTPLRQTLILLAAAINGEMD